MSAPTASTLKSVSPRHQIVVCDGDETGQELLDEAHGIANRPDRRPALIGVLEEGGQSLHQLALALREKTLVLR